MRYAICIALVGRSRLRAFKGELVTLETRHAKTPGDQGFADLVEIVQEVPSLKAATQLMSDRKALYHQIILNTKNNKARKLAGEWYANMS